MSNLQKCRDCGTEYPYDDFPAAGIVKGKFYRRRKCQACHQKVKRKRRGKLRLWVEKCKRELQCEKCGEQDFRVLDFHHKDKNKEFNVADGHRLGYCIERIQAEIDKCQCLCCKCHRILHYEEKYGH